MKDERILKTSLIGINNSNKDEECMLTLSVVEIFVFGMSRASEVHALCLVFI